MLLQQFPNGFRLLKESNPEDKFFVIDELDFEVGATYQVGPNGYFEYRGVRTPLLYEEEKEREDV